MPQVIRVRGIRAEGRHGASAGERDDPQPFEVDLDVEVEAAGVVDDGEAYDALRGVVVTGRVEVAEDDPRLAAAERAWSEKYLAGNEPPYRRWRNRVWLRLVPERTASWDFRKIPEARARRTREG